MNAQIYSPPPVRLLPVADFLPDEWEPRRFSRRLMEVTAGQSQEEVGQKLGYSGSRIGQVQRGQRPSREFIERLVEGYALDRKEWLELAGYRLGKPDAPIDETTVRSVEEALRRMGLSDQRKLADTENPGDRFVRLARSLVAACTAVNVPPPPAINWSLGTNIPDTESTDQLLRQLVDQHAREYPEHAAVYRMWLHNAGLDRDE